MSYYPILKAPGCHGWATLCNYPPNNWEVRDHSDKYINVTWREHDIWRTENIGKLAAHASLTININDVASIVPEQALPFLSLSMHKVSKRSEYLPKNDYTSTITPAWRATLGLSTKTASTSYLGEIDPFPAHGSLLSFCLFMQFGNAIENYLILLNIENEPKDLIAGVS